MSGYPLATLLGLRGREEVAARASLARALAAEDRRRTERDAAVARAAAQRATLDREVSAAPAGGALTGATLRERASFAQRLRRHAAALDAIAREAERRVLEAEADTPGHRSALAAARRALRAIERHRDAWRSQAARARGRREEAACDDLVSALRAAP